MGHHLWLFMDICIRGKIWYIPPGPSSFLDVKRRTGNTLRGCYRWGLFSLVHEWHLPVTVVLGKTGRPTLTRERQGTKTRCSRGPPCSPSPNTVFVDLLLLWWFLKCVIGPKTSSTIKLYVFPSPQKIISKSLSVGTIFGSPMTPTPRWSERRLNLWGVVFHGFIFNKERRYRRKEKAG